MMRLPAWVAVATLVTSPAAVTGQAPATPLDPVTAVLDAFRTHDVVALSEGRHNNEQGMAFRMALVRDPRLPGVVNDIVVESGSSRHQDLMDRFIGGESVPDSSLRRAWQDTTQPDAVWDVPMYEEFFRAIRAINDRLPRERRLRVLLGDPPFDWEKAPTREAWLQLNRDAFPAGLIQREVLANHRRALVIYGGAHLARGRSAGEGNLVARLESLPQPPRVFNVWTHTDGDELLELQADIAAWPVPALALTRGTGLGAAPYTFYRPGPGNGARMEERFDAVLYVGPVSKVVVRRGQIAPSLCNDAEYLRMRLSRMALIDPPDRPLPPGVVRPADALKRYCASGPTERPGA